MKKIVLIFLISIISQKLWAQDSEKILIDKPDETLSLEQVISSIEQTHRLRFFFKKEWLDGIDPYAGEYPVDLKTFVEKTFSPHEITFFMRDRSVILYQKNYASINLEKGLADDDEVRIVGEGNSPLDEKVTVSGKIVDGQSGDILPGAVIRVEENDEGVVANPNGEFQIQLYPGLYTFKINFVGFEETMARVFIKSTGSTEFTLFESSLELDAVTIEEFAIDQNVNSAQVSVTNLDMKTIKSIPALLGEADIVKSVLLLPGVSTVGEGSTGFNVRGGAADQNLLVYDKAPIFNPSHLFGFFSNINPDAIKDVTLFKGGIPARFGGRVSSVLEINSRNPSTEDVKLKGGIGLVSSRLTADIPLVKGKSALLIGGRASYIDWLLDRVKNVEVRQSSAQFYDLNGKWTAKVGKKDFLSVSGYLSNDDFKFAADTVYGWQTQNLNASWVHTFSDDLSGEIALISANYGYKVDGEVPSTEFLLESNINNRSIAANFFYNAGVSHKLIFGGTYGTYDFNIGDLNPIGSESAVDPINLEAEHAREFAIFIQDEYK
ncbi:MAG: TonB-dependent receptor, partial [Bacteroidota bacterium]